MFKWLHSRVNRRGHAAQPAGFVTRRLVQPDGGTTDRRRGGRRVDAGRRESDFLAQRTEAPRVLIIASNLDTRLLYTMLFEQAGCTVYAADEDPAGIAMAQHHLPDVVVAEGSAQTPTAFDTLGQLRATRLTANIPVVVITSSVHFDMPVHTRAPGTILVLARPVDPDKLITRFQPIDATISASLAAGVWYPSVIRGRVFSRRAIASRRAWLNPDKSAECGRYWRSRPLVFSLEPRCQGLCGSQK